MYHIFLRFVSFAFSQFYHKAQELPENLNLNFPQSFYGTHRLKEDEDKHVREAISALQMP